MGWMLFLRPGLLQAFSTMLSPLNLTFDFSSLHSNGIAVPGAPRICHLRLSSSPSYSVQAAPQLLATQPESPASYSLCSSFILAFDWLQAVHMAAANDNLCSVLCVQFIPRSTLGHNYCTTLTLTSLGTQLPAHTACKRQSWGSNSRLFD